MRILSGNVFLLIGVVLQWVDWAFAACIPDVPERLLADPEVLDHPAVVAAFEEVKKNLSALYVNTTRDGLSFAIVHASTPENVFAFNNGTLKNNETAGEDNLVTSDSIFRIASISKNFATFTALIMENQSQRLSQSTNASLPKLELNMNTPVRQLLPDFSLPEKDWNDGGRDITLNMLASHSAGLTREAYSTDFHMVTGTGKADANTIGAAWAGVTPEDVMAHARKTNLMFAPGQRAGYSNAGISILANAVTAYYNTHTDSTLTWIELAAQEVFSPLNMSHSFFSTIPDALIPDIGVPGGPNWADLIVGLGYDPAAGMWSSANDLTKYLHHAWLQEDPKLISIPQRRKSLKPTYALPDGTQQAGAGWEIDVYTAWTSKNTTTALEKVYASYGKAGDGGGWHAWIDTVPNLGYGVVVLSQHSGLADYARVVPTTIRDWVHEILIPPFAEALASRVEARFAGSYADGQDTGLIAEQVNATSATPNTTTYARLEIEEQILYIRELVVNGTSALEGLDRLGWTEEDQSRYWSTPEGVALTPSEGAGEKAQFGPGAEVWRMMLPGLEKCDWWDFDGYTDQNGWPLSKVVLVEKDGGVELHYPPYDIVLTREASIRPWYS